MEIEFQTTSSSTLLVYSQDVESTEDRKLVEKIAHSFGAAQIKILNGNNFDEHMADLENWFLIILSWTGSGDEAAFTRRFRKAAPYAPILVFAGTKDQSARDLAFAVGIDNYISPGASEAEVTSKAHRLKTVAEMARIAEAPLIFGDISIWLQAKMVMREREPISLSCRETAILMYLAAHSPNAATRTDIEQEALGIRFDPGTNVVAVHVHRIRQKIGDSKENRLIQSIPGVGYRLCQPTPKLLSARAID